MSKGHTSFYRQQRVHPINGVIIFFSQPGAWILRLWVESGWPQPFVPHSVKDMKTKAARLGLVVEAAAHNASLHSSFSIFCGSLCVLGSARSHSFSRAVIQWFGGSFVVALILPMPVVRCSCPGGFVLAPPPFSCSAGGSPRASSL